MFHESYLGAELHGTLHLVMEHKKKDAVKPNGLKKEKRKKKKEKRKRKKKKEKRKRVLGKL